MIETIMLIGVGGFFILLGLAAKKYPDLIAGYNTMSPQKKKEVDVEKLSLLIRNMLFTVGLIIVVGAIIIAVIGHEETVIEITFAVSFGIMIVVGVFYPTPKKPKK